MIFFLPTTFCLEYFMFKNCVSWFADYKFLKSKLHFFRVLEFKHFLDYVHHTNEFTAQNKYC